MISSAVNIHNKINFKFPVNYFQHWTDFASSRLDLS